MGKNEKRNPHGSNPRFTSGLTSEQLKQFGEVCQTCGTTYGEHKAEGFNCPAVPPAKGFRETVFAGAELGMGLLRLDRLEKIVSFNCSRGLRNAQVVEIVAGGKLPTTKGLRHITDKRRPVKARADESYVLCDITGPGSLRDRLFWPDARSIHWDVINPVG